MTTTLDVPKIGESAPTTDIEGTQTEELRVLERSLEHRSIRRDNWTVMMFGVAIVALFFSIAAIGFGVRAIDEAKGRPQAVPSAGAPAGVPAVVPAPAPAALTSVTLSDMKVTPSSVSVPAGKYTVTINNAGMMTHELLVFHTDIAPADLPIGPDGKVNEDAPGFKISDGDDLDPGASQSRVIDLSQPGTYLFVCNLPGHFAAGMHSTVTVK
ncbi:MAG: hypothetical protein QOF30_1888 [Acidimicrobiaceae bacterium]|nr:hypothetical protein [Acidimicrobiaceae bacterium]